MLTSGLGSESMFDAQFWQVIFLGVVQGITEFLPISSDGHLTVCQIFLSRWFGPSQGDEQPLELVLALHVGTLLSIIVVYWRDLKNLIAQPRVCWLIVLATIPAGVVGLTLKKSIEQTFQSPLIAGFGFLITAGTLLLGQRLERNERALESLGQGETLLIGVCQAFALLPGVSRSGSTISAALSAGLKRDAAARFSFLIAVPAIGGASVLLVKDLVEQGGSSHSALNLIAGGIVSFIVGLAALRVLIRVVVQGKLHWFAYYCLVLGTLVIAYELLVGTSRSP